jgi:hypothetical protein
MVAFLEGSRKEEVGLFEGNRSLGLCPGKICLVAVHFLFS